MNQMQPLDMLISELVHQIKVEPMSPAPENYNSTIEIFPQSFEDSLINQSNVSSNSTITQTQKPIQKRRSYTISKKLETIEIYEKVQSYQITSALADVPTYLIQNWVKDKNRLNEFSILPYYKKLPKTIRDLNDEFEMMLVDLVYFKKCLQGSMTQAKLLEHAETLRKLMGYKEVVTVAWIRAFIRKRNINLKN